ncbi:PLC-like phosphodiesterases superfamily protein [Zea mays]|uniref:PLC-like phosphodiesterases superfamily protein n=1 Tax=Zea mays TaxID=4577 RepID=A0A1D6E541_MAIZE|nr:PLC-like phosphodiesterases superfamily protein [Zea mays]
MAVVATIRQRRCFVLVLGTAIVVAFSALFGTTSGAALVGDSCRASSSTSDGGGCGKGLRCTTCVPPPGTGPAACARTTPVDPKTHGTGLPFNRYSWLTTHNSFAVVGTKSPLGSAIISPPNQEDSVTDQLKNGVRGLMLDAYDFNDAVWFCHSFHGRCLTFTAYVPALSVLTEVRVFLDANPSEVVTVFLEDYAAPGSLSNTFNAAGLSKYWFPEAQMPSPSKGGGDWPLLRDMIADNHRLIVFTSKKGKQGTEGLAYQWDYVVETQYGSEGMADGSCPKRTESKPMDSKAQSLVLLNFFTSNPSQSWACSNNSAPLISRLNACYHASAKRWPNDIANGRLQCGHDNIAHCKISSASAPAPASASSPAPASASSPSPAPAPDFAATSPAISSSPGPAPGPLNSYY